MPSRTIVRIGSGGQFYWCTPVAAGQRLLQIFLNRKKAGRELCKRLALTLYALKGKLESTSSSGCRIFTQPGILLQILCAGEDLEGNMTNDRRVRFTSSRMRSNTRQTSLPCLVVIAILFNSSLKMLARDYSGVPGSGMLRTRCPGAPFGIIPNFTVFASLQAQYRRIPLPHSSQEIIISLFRSKWPPQSKPSMRGFGRTKCWITFVQLVRPPTGRRA